MSDPPRAPFAEPDTFVAVEPRWWLSNLGGMVVFGVAASRSRSKLMRLGFAVAVALHVGEAAYAYDKARRAGFSSSAGRWALQTLGVGFPSLLALRDAVEDAGLDPLAIDLTARAPATS
jgi:hypothetical protein